MGLLMKSFLVLCIVCFCRGDDIHAGDSFTLKRLHLTDEAVLGLLRRVETLESGRSNVCAVQGMNKSKNVGEVKRKCWAG